MLYNFKEKDIVHLEKFIIAHHRQRQRVNTINYLLFVLKYVGKYVLKTIHVLHYLNQ